MSIKDSTLLEDIQSKYRFYWSLRWKLDCLSVAKSSNIIDTFWHSNSCLQQKVQYRFFLSQSHSRVLLYWMRIRFSGTLFRVLIRILIVWRFQKSANMTHPEIQTLLFSVFTGLISSIKVSIENLILILVISV